MDSINKTEDKDKIRSNAVELKYLKPMASIYSQIQMAKRPLVSRDIHVQCSRSLKEWILKKLVTLGKIEKVQISDVRYVYKVKEEKKEGQE